MSSCFYVMGTLRREHRLPERHAVRLVVRHPGLTYFRFWQTSTMACTRPSCGLSIKGIPL